MGSLTQILGILNIQMPGLDTDAFDLSSLLFMLNNLTEEKGEEQITATMTLPIIGDLTLICDLNYSLKQVTIPTTNIDESTTITFSGDIDYPGEANIDAVDADKYIDATSLFDALSGTLNYLNRDFIGLDLDIKYNDLSFKGELSANLKELSSVLSMNIFDKELRLVGLDNIAYLEYGNLNFSFNLEESNLVTDIVKQQFGIDIPLDMITSILTALKNGNLFEVLGGFNIKTDLSSMDLSLGERVVQEGASCSMVRKDMGRMVLVII